PRRGPASSPGHHHPARPRPGVAPARPGERGRPMPPRGRRCCRIGFMHAVVVHEHGGPEVLSAGEADVPVPGPGELLVKVAAAGVNFVDIYHREGRPPYGGPVPYIPGAEGAGTVAATGPDVTGLA